MYLLYIKTLYKHVYLHYYIFNQKFYVFEMFKEYTVAFIKFLK